MDRSIDANSKGFINDWAKVVIALIRNSAKINCLVIFF